MLVCYIFTCKSKMNAGPLLGQGLRVNKVDIKTSAKKKKKKTKVHHYSFMFFSVTIISFTFGEEPFSANDEPLNLNLTKNCTYLNYWSYYFLIKIIFFGYHVEEFCTSNRIVKF